MGAALKLVPTLPEPDAETRRLADVQRPRLLPFTRSRPWLVDALVERLEAGTGYNVVERHEAARQLRSGEAFVAPDLDGRESVVLASGLRVSVPR